MQPLKPTFTFGLFRPLHHELIGCLRSLDTEQWNQPTMAGEWRVRDVVAHLLDGDLRRLSFHRDGHPVPTPSAPIESFRDLVGVIDAMNHEWVRLARRLSPALLIDLLELSGSEMADFVEQLAPFETGLFGVAWAGDEISPNWMDIGREFTERWHHQQQIRLAVDAPLLLSAEWMRPLLELSVRCLPRAFAGVEASDGTAIQLNVEGEGGGVWVLGREEQGWEIYAGYVESAAARVRLSTDLAWRLFYNGLPSGEALSAISVSGDADLVAPLLGARAVMV